MLPGQFDHLTFREILLVIRADDDREKAEWKQTAVICTFIFNYSTQKKKGTLPKQPGQLFPKLYGHHMRGFMRRYQQALDQEAIYLGQLKAKQERLEREAAQKETS